MKLARIYGCSLVRIYNYECSKDAVPVQFVILNVVKNLI